MEEELIEFVMERADACYADDFPIREIETWICEFFDQYQPERLSPKDHCPKCDTRLFDYEKQTIKECDTCYYTTAMVSDSLNQANK